jgi:hypothetical protein
MAEAFGVSVLMPEASGRVKEEKKNRNEEMDQK